MKRIFIILLSVYFLWLPVFADDVTVTDENITEGFESENFIPEKIQESLSKGKIDVNSPKVAKSVLGFVSEAIRNVFYDYSENIHVLLTIIITTSVFCKFIDNKCFKTIITYILSLVILIQVLEIVKRVLQSATDALNSVSEILSAVLPAFSAVLLMGGSTFTSVTQSASFGIVLTLLNYTIKTFLLPAVSLLMLLLTFEKLSPQFSEMNLLRFFKKNMLTAIAFLTTIMITVISYQHIVSAGKDSISGRTVKFAAANFIPIVGAAVGESLKTIGAGLKHLKTTVGGAVMLSLFITVLPVILQIILIKICLNFLAFTAGLTGCKSEQGLIEASISILDILNAIIICSAILSLLLVITFIFSIFPLST